jgi:hypothetical protein
MTEIRSARILTLFGSGVPLCVECGASAESCNLSGNPTHPTLCRLHWKTERELINEAIARADRVLKQLE